MGPGREVGRGHHQCERSRSGQSEESGRYENDGGRDHRLDEVHPVVGQDVQVGRGMVHGVEVPERRYLVPHPMSEPEREIAEQKGHDGGGKDPDVQVEMHTGAPEHLGVHEIEDGPPQRQDGQREKRRHEDPDQVLSSADGDHAATGLSRPQPLHDQEDADQSPVPRIEDCRPPSGPHVGTDRVGGVPVDGRKGVMGIQGQPGHQQGHEHQGRCTTDPTAPPALPIATVVGDDTPVFQRSLAWSRTWPRPRPPNTPPIVAQSVRLPTARGRATRGHPDPIEISPRAGLPGATDQLIWPRARSRVERMPGHEGR